MAHYLLSVHHAEGDPSPSDDEMQRAYEQVDALNDELRSSGAWVFAGGLQPPAAARVVRGSGESASTTDGPFVESKEHLGGFWIIEADDEDAALAWGRRAADACMEPVEVKPFDAMSDVAPTAQGLPGFMLSVHMGGSGEHVEPMTDEQRQESWQRIQELEADLQQRGRWMYSARLGAPDRARVVREDDGDAVVTDGPFTESKEHLAGFYIVGAEDVHEALEIGRRVTACVGAPIEVRPFQVEPTD